MSKDIDVFASSLIIPAVGELASGLRQRLHAHATSRRRSGGFR